MITNTNGRGGSTMEGIPLPTESLSPKAITVWRIRHAIIYIMTLMLLSVTLLIAYYYNWFEWVQTLLFVLIGICLLQTIYKTTIYPILLQKTWRYSIDESYIQIRSGIFHTYHMIIPISRVEYVKTHQGPVLRKFHLAKLTIGTMTTTIDIPEISEDVAKTLRDEIVYYTELDTMRDDGNENDTVKTDMLFPFIRAQSLVKNISPSNPLQKEMHHLPKQAYFVALIQPSYLLVIITFFVFFFWPELWIIPILYTFFIILKRWMTTKQQQFVWTNHVIQMQTGSFSIQITVTKRNKIDALVIDQSWLEHKLGLASIKITSRANPVQIREIERMHVDDATLFYEWYQKRD